MKRIIWKSLLLAIALTLASAALLAQTVVKATLDGAQEVPKQSTAGNGEALYVISADRTQINYTLIVRNIGTTITLSHIHLGPPDLSAGVILNLFIAATDGAFKGKVTGILTAADFKANTDLGLLTFSDVIDNMIRGNTYTNVHTSRVPGGEIRGQNIAIQTK